ncbi:afadin- and alpha-actinin-binding protein-like isoform x2 [Gigaspora margarita]|uniref:Afadin- and alpha-actinin-binding protein-like isoform x2 n=2 Tax=Gigaspora margarita TaxID=4874 RepID=A0A8H4AX13_GIGMA|nr:afadin- and alpha-actinin-binding protein-like isoform x2 [Gigaspora margarita]
MADNIYLIQQLSACGYQFPLDFFNNKDEESATKIVECISALLQQQQQQDAAYREEMHDQHQKLQSDYELLTFTIKTLKTRAELSEREVDTLKAKLIKIEDHLQLEFEKHRSTKDELIKTKANLQNVKSQAMHDIRKRETEYTRFKEKMQKLLSDKYHSTCGPQGVNPPRKQLVKSMHYTTSFINCDADAPINVKQDGDADARDKDLLLENSKLRKLLFEVHNQVTSFIGSQTQMRFASIDPELASLKTPESYNSRAAHTQLPFELFAQNLEEEVKDLLLALKFEWNNRPVFEDFQQKDVEIRHKHDEIRQKIIEIMQKDVEIRQKDDETKQKDVEILQKNDVIRQKDDEIKQKDVEILQKNDVIRQKDDEIKKKDIEIRQKTDVIRQKDDEIKKKDIEIRQKNDIIRQKDDEIKKKDIGVRQKNDVVRQKDDEIKKKDIEIRQKNDVIRQKDDEVKKKDIEIRQKNDVIRQKDDEIKQKDVEIRQKNEEVKQKGVEIRQKDDEIKQKDGEIRQRDGEIRQKDDKIRQKNEEIKKKEEMICAIYEMCKQYNK